jgi:hypothetical protein
VRAVQAHAHDGRGSEHLSRSVRAEAADRFESHFEIFVRVREHCRPDKVVGME